MMKNIQEYINLLTTKKEKAQQQADKFVRLEILDFAAKYQKEADAFSFCITYAELLLDKDTTASAETTHCANTRLGECAASAETLSLKEPAGGICETPAVRQNEQTKEVCDRCGTEMYERGAFIKCPSCDHW